MFSQALLNRSLQGVSFPRVGSQHLHKFFADDIHAVVKACLRIIGVFQRILQRFGAFSGLHCAWDQTVAACIPAVPPPPQLRLLPWKWEDDETPTLLLGVPVAQTISTQRWSPS